MATTVMTSRMTTPNTTLILTMQATQDVKIAMETTARVARARDDTSRAAGMFFPVFFIIFNYTNAYFRVIYLQMENEI